MVQKVQPKNTEKFKLFGAWNLDLDLMTSVLILSLNIILVHKEPTGEMVKNLWLRNTERFKLFGTHVTLILTQ